MTFHSKPKPKIQQFYPKGPSVNKLLVSTVVVVGLSVSLAPPVQAFPCAGPDRAWWCAPRDGSDPFKPREAGDHLVRPSAKLDVNDGREPAISFRRPS